MINICFSAVTISLCMGEKDQAQPTIVVVKQTLVCFASGLTALVNVKMIEMANQIKVGGVCVLFCLVHPAFTHRRANLSVAERDTLFPVSLLLIYNH